MPGCVRDLPVEQATILWCLRTWIATCRFNRISEQIRRLAGQLGVTGASEFLVGYMTALDRGATRLIEIGPLRCPIVGPDEQMLLDALGLAQERRTFEAMLVLRPTFEAGAIRDAVVNAEELGHALARIGRFLPAPAVEHGEPDVSTWFLTTNP